MHRGKATITTDQERQYIRSRAKALCQRAAVLCQRATVLCTHMHTQLTSLETHRAQLTAHRYRLQELVYQQRSMRGACFPQGRRRHTEIVVLTNLVSRLRRPFGL